MRRLILAAALVVALQPAAFARTAMETNQLVDDYGMPIGTAANPLYVSGGVGGGGGGGGGAVTQGPAATDIPANRWPVLAYQGGTWTFGLSGPIPAGSNVIGGVTQSGAWNVGLSSGAAVLADIRVSGAPNTSSNPIFAQITSGTLTLGAGSATIGSIANTAFGISGTLPAFAAPPTFNVGTTGGLALDQTIINRFGLLGQKTASGSAPVVLASDQTLPLPTGAATAANQTSEISAINTRTSQQSEPAAASVAAAGTNYGFSHQTTIPSPWTRYAATGQCNGAGTLLVQGSNDNFAQTSYTVANAAITATLNGTISVPVIYSSYRAAVLNSGGSAITCGLAAAYAVN